MGIPSFYRHLLRKYKGLVSGSVKELGFTKVDVFALDFNCIIYAAMKTMGLVAKGDLYEVALRREVGCWLERLVGMVNPKELLYIAVDGSVPCAKIHQQRLRRYKSIWIKKDQDVIRSTMGLGPAEEGWDRNAITPGTAFMDEMNAFLRRKAKEFTGISVIVSGSDEAGEGEHKIMRYLRTVEGKDVVVYGLDADLILLGMLHSQLSRNKILLCRELGEGKVENVSQLALQFLNPTATATVLWKETCRTTDVASWTFDYVTIMSILGNDFLPHSLGWAIRDEAITEVLRGLEEVCAKAGARLTQVVDAKHSTINCDVLYLFFVWASTHEEKRVGKWLQKRLNTGPSILRESDPLKRALEEREAEPARRKEESFLFQNGWVKPDWRLLLETHHFRQKERVDIAARDFLHGFAWVQTYYWNSDEADTSWYYPWSHAPTFSTLARVLGETGLPSATAIRGETQYVDPLVQLVMVLPPASFHLLPSSVKAHLQRYFEYCPESFDLEYFGKHFLWECEPCIPFLPRKVAEQIVHA